MKLHVLRRAYRHGLMIILMMILDDPHDNPRWSSMILMMILDDPHDDPHDNPRWCSSWSQSNKRTRPPKRHVHEAHSPSIRDDALRNRLDQKSIQQQHRAVFSQTWVHAHHEGQHMRLRETSVRKERWCAWLSCTNYIYNIQYPNCRIWATH